MSHILAQVNRSDISVTRIVVSGHSDRLSEVDYNQKLSEERAKSVVDYLIFQEIKIPIECLQPDRRVSYGVIIKKNRL